VDHRRRFGSQRLRLDRKGWRFVADDASQISVRGVSQVNVSMDDVTVSVCMLTYNHERFIAQAVESALAQQTTFAVEIVIGEDCSTDGTRSILQDLAERHVDRIRLRLADHNQGAKANFIESFGRCRGEYVALLEGDDYWTDPRKLQVQVDALRARPDWAMCFHPTRVLFEDCKREPEVWPTNWKLPEATLVDLFKENFIPTSGVLFRNHLFPALPSWFHESQLGDWPLHILNAAHGNIGFVSEVMSVYRVHANGIWSGLDPATQLAVIFRMFTSVDDHFAGRYRKEIDENRLTTLQWLIGELNRVRALQQQDLATHERDIAVLRKEYAALQETAARLSEEHQVLKASQQITSPENGALQRLWNQMRRLVRGGPAGPQPPGTGPASPAT
jgi:glycosyltransferase involved in cell wall biosynthesis